MPKAIVYTLEEAVAKTDWIAEPTYLETCGDRNVLHFEGGSSLALEVPLCPNCEIELNVAEGRPTTCVCDGCEEEIEL